MSDLPRAAIELIDHPSLPPVLAEAIGQAICEEFDLHSDDDKRRFALDLLAARQHADARREANQAIALAMLDPTLARHLAEALDTDAEGLREQAAIVLKMLGS